MQERGEVECVDLLLRIKDLITKFACLYPQLVSDRSCQDSCSTPTEQQDPIVSARALTNDDMFIIIPSIEQMQKLQTQMELLVGCLPKELRKSIVSWKK